MSACDHDAGAGISLAARTAAAATAAAKQLGSVFGFTRRSPSPSEVPPSPPTPLATAPSVEGVRGAVEELTVSEEGKKKKDCEREDEGAASARDGRLGLEEVTREDGIEGEDGQEGEEKEKKTGKGKGNKGKPFPQRPGEADCSFYVRTGKCAYGPGCKYNHPPDRLKKGKAQQPGTPESDKVFIANATKLDKDCRQVEKLKCKYFASPKGCKYGNACIYSHYIEKVEVEIELNFLGLPIRPGEKECPLYMETGACTDSTNCKYNHPNPTAFGGGSDQSPEFSSSGTSLLLDFGNASWDLECTSNGLHPYIDATLPYMQGTPAMHQVSPSNCNWHAYQASSDPWLNHGSGQNHQTATSEDPIECRINESDHPRVNYDFIGNEEFSPVSTHGIITPVSTYGIISESRTGGKHPPTGTTNNIAGFGGNANHLPAPNASAAKGKKGSGKHTPVDASNDTFKVKGTGKMAANSFPYVPLEGNKGKKKQKQSPSTNLQNLAKNSGTDKPVSISSFVPKEQGKEQPPLDTRYKNEEGKGNHKETNSHCIPKCMGSGNKSQGGIHHDDTKEEEWEKKSTKGKGKESNLTKNGGNKAQGNIYYNGTKEKECENMPRKGKGNESNPTKNSGNKSQGIRHYDDTKEGIEKKSTKGKGNESNLTKNNGHESQPTKCKKDEKHSPAASTHYVPKGKAKEEQHPGSTDHDDSDGRGNENNPTKNSGNESQPTKKKKNEKYSPVVHAHYVPKAKTKEQNPGSTDHDDSEGKGNGNHFSVAIPTVLVSAIKSINHPLATSDNPANTGVCENDLLIDISASSSLINEKVYGKLPADVNFSDVTKRTDGSKSNQPTKLTEIPIRSGHTECPHYLKKGSCKNKSCKYNHPEGPHQIQSDVTKITDGSISNQPTQLTALPRRPGQPECPYYLKKGGCKYKSCKFDHPKDPNQLENSSNCLLSSRGLPLRPGRPICTHYSQRGICTYGPVCKYDHPMDVIPSQSVAK